MIIVLEILEWMIGGAIAAVSGSLLVEFFRALLDHGRRDAMVQRGFVGSIKNMFH